MLNEVLNTAFENHVLFVSPPVIAPGAQTFYLHVYIALMTFCMTYIAYMTFYIYRIYYSIYR